MTAERLREAAARLRELGGAASGGVDDWYSDVDSFASMLDVEFPTDIRTREAAEYISAMHPRVAYALAEWLEATVDPDRISPNNREWMSAEGVADAILGDA